MLEKSNLILLSTKELKEINISEMILSTQQYLLLETVIKFNLLNAPNEFVIFFQQETNDMQEKNDLEKKIRVNKSRLNTSIKEFNLYIDRNFKLYKIDTMSLEFLKNEAPKIIKNHIKSIKIYDAYNGLEKDNFLSNEVKIILKNMIKNDENNKTIEIISILNNNHTKEFYKELLEYQNSLNKNVVEIKYMRNTFIQSSSLFYVLINDIENIDYIIYWEKITKWSVLTEVSKDKTFTNKFYHLLNERFNHYFMDIDGELHNKKDIIDVNINTFKTNFLDETKKFISKIESFMFLNIASKDEIKKEFYELFEYLKEIQISFPEEDSSIIVLYHFLKLAELSLIFKITDDLTITKSLIKQVINSQIHLKIYRQLHDEIKRQNNKFLISINEIKNIELQTLRHSLNVKSIVSEGNKRFFIIDLFPNSKWNTYEQIKDSLNLIIEKNDDAKIVLSLLILNFENINLSENITKIILRIIFDVLYNIPFSNKIILNEKEKKEFQKINFTNYSDEIDKKIFNTLEVNIGY